ncbi:hypothetical protein [Lactobacillus johnsonii]|uniref:Uncharacterized protein n=1 Tax=Lactobacillus johnsonii TaxID=33959 RepID=A0A9X0J6J9_LACJH|nr:hypothetical protein [Lactobacillus johnsonii]KXN75989.1 hypothetical protein AYJ53_08180 [Lactobacillus johnsonii]
MHYLIKQVLWPPVIKYPLAIVGTIITFIGITIELTDSINLSWKQHIYWIYVSLIIIIYFLGLIANCFIFAIKLSKITDNNQGLTKQHQIDLNDKKKLKGYIKQKDIFFEECWKRLSPEDKQLVLIEVQRRKEEIGFESSEDN